MNLPFTHEQFLAVFAAYNAAVWPAAGIAYGVAAAICWAMVRRHPAAAPIAALGLAVMWLWTGIAYHLIFFSRVNPAAVAFGGAFAFQGVLFIAAAWRQQLDFVGGGHAWRQVGGWALIVYAALAYPLIGALSGLHYPATPVFGITPCPVTLFTFGVLLLSARVPWWLLPIPVAWSLIGGSAAWQLGIIQDWMLAVSAAAAIPMLRSPRIVPSPARGRARITPE